MKILTICPSRGRPEECKRMLESFSKTKRETNSILILLDSDDKTNEELREYLEPVWNSLEYYKDFYLSVAHRESITQRINGALKANIDDYEFFHLTNDDVIYRTNGWDTELTAAIGYKPGVAYGNDLFQGKNHPTFPMISAEIVKKLGWIQMPTLNRYYGDSVWKIIGMTLDCLHYCPDVIIEHCHHLAGKSEHKTDEEIYKQDKQAFGQWLTRAHIDIGKIRKVRDGKRN